MSVGEHRRPLTSAEREFVEESRPDAHRLARWLARRYRVLSFDDITAVVEDALMDEARRFQPLFGLKLLDFARRRVIRDVLRAARRQLREPVQRGLAGSVAHGEAVEQIELEERVGETDDVMVQRCVAMGIEAGLAYTLAYAAGPLATPLSASAEELMQGEEERRELWASVGALGPESLALLHLLYAEGLTFGAAATRLGITVPSAKYQEQVALRELRRRVAPGHDTWYERLPTARALLAHPGMFDLLRRLVVPDDEAVRDAAFAELADRAAERAALAELLRTADETSVRSSAFIALARHADSRPLLRRILTEEIELIEETIWSQRVEARPDRGLLLDDPIRQTKVLECLLDDPEVVPILRRILGPTRIAEERAHARALLEAHVEAAPRERAHAEHVLFSACPEATRCVAVRALADDADARPRLMDILGDIFERPTVRATVALALADAPEVRRLAHAVLREWRAWASPEVELHAALAAKYGTPSDARPTRPNPVAEIMSEIAAAEDPMPFIARRMHLVGADEAMDEIVALGEKKNAPWLRPFFLLHRLAQMTSEGWHPHPPRPGALGLAACPGAVLSDGLCKGTTGALSTFVDLAQRRAAKLVRGKSIGVGPNRDLYFTYEEEDLRLFYLTRQLARTRVDRAGYRAIFGADPTAHFGDAVEAAASAALATLDEQALRLTPLGMVYADSVAGLLAWRRVESLRAAGAGRRTRDLLDDTMMYDFMG